VGIACHAAQGLVMEHNNLQADNQVAGRRMGRQNTDGTETGTQRSFAWLCMTAETFGSVPAQLLAFLPGTSSEQHTFLSAVCCTSSSNRSTLSLALFLKAGIVFST
jgi:hypothetical protein